MSSFSGINGYFFRVPFFCYWIFDNAKHYEKMYVPFKNCLTFLTYFLDLEMGCNFWFNFITSNLFSDIFLRQNFYQIGFRKEIYSENRKPLIWNQKLHCVSIQVLPSCCHPWHYEWPCNIAIFLNPSFSPLGNCILFLKLFWPSEGKFLSSN